MAVTSLAPMEGITSFPTRLWLHMASQPQAMTTPFLRVTQRHPEGELPWTFAPELGLLRGALPYVLTPQLISGDPEHVLRTMALLPPELCPVVELNCGCPSPNSLGKLAGSGMLRDAASFGRQIARLAQHLGPGRLAVKMRLGIADPAEFPALIGELAPLPLARLTVHGRTRADGYRGEARWDAVRLAAKTLSYPVWGSGDILGSETLAKLATPAAAAGTMIGRGALRNPWIFSELRRGEPVRLSLGALAHALLVYLLLQDLWLQQPQKLAAYVAKGRLGHPCSSDAGAWMKAAADLTSLSFGVPCLLSARGELPPAWAPTPTAWRRLRLLWAYLRSSLPPELATPRLMRARCSEEFFTLLFDLGDALGLLQQDLELRHQTSWDPLFGGARGDA